MFFPLLPANPFGAEIPLLLTTPLEKGTWVVRIPLEAPNEFKVLLFGDGGGLLFDSLEKGTLVVRIPLEAPNEFKVLLFGDDGGLRFDSFPSPSVSIIITLFLLLHVLLTLRGLVWYPEILALRGLLWQDSSMGAGGTYTYVYAKEKEKKRET